MHSNTTLPKNLPAIQSWAKAEIKAGSSPAVIAAEVTANYPGLTLGDVLPPVTLRNVMRSMAQGLTMEHADELVGLGASNIARLFSGQPMNQPYDVAARDQMRLRDQAFAGSNPGTNFAARVGGGMVPAAAAMMIGAAPVAGQLAMNTVRAGVTSGVMGAMSGAGASEADTPGGVAWDAAMGGGVGAVGGGLVGNVASRIADRALRGTANRVLTEASYQMPRLPVMDPAHVLSRQATLAPGTAVIADFAPEVQGLVSVIGADRAVAQQARQAAAKRVMDLRGSLKPLGAFYESLKGKVVPLDAEISDALLQASRRIKGDTKLPDLNIREALRNKDKSVDLGALRNIRSIIGDMADATKNGELRNKLGEMSGRITEWIEANGGQGLKQTDADYAFLIERQTAAEKTLDLISKAGSSAAQQRLRSGPKISIPLPMRGGVGTTIRQEVPAAMGPSASATAKAVVNWLLTPTATPDALARMAAIQAAMGTKQPVMGAATDVLGGMVLPMLTPGLSQRQP